MKSIFVVVFALLVCLVSAGCGSRGNYYPPSNTYGGGGYTRYPVGGPVIVHHYGSYGYGGRTVTHVYHGGFGGSHTVVHHYH